MDDSLLMVDVWSIHISWVTYGTFMSYGLHMEHSRSWLTYRSHLPHGRQSEHQNQQSTDNNYLSVIGINFPTPFPTT